jgi:lipopolysaccharide transport system ATP-binding protein
MKPVLSATGISKLYKISHKPSAGSVKEFLNEIPKRLFGAKTDKPDRSEDFWALRDLDLDIYPGDSLGVLGTNGSGKSTLLKIISRVVNPTHGYFDVRGRVASLLEVGTGFHPELTGRENIYLNGTILGLNRKTISKQFDSIVEFSEAENFLEMPVKHYSSGMYMRLAFAVAAHVTPDVLIMDEVLAVGDAKFQKKCLNRLSELASNGTALLFVSHNREHYERLCTKALWLENGKEKDHNVPTTEILDHFFGPTDKDPLC